MTQLVALPDGTELAGDYKIVRVLGAGGFGVTYLAEENSLSRLVSIKEYFPSDFAWRGDDLAATPRSEGCRGDYQWGLDRFIDEGQTLAKFNHPNIVRVYRVFRANNTAYMVLHFEEGKSLKTWLKDLGRAPRQKELDAMIAPMLDALDTIHKADFLHRDIAPDNIIIRNNGEPVLIDFGAARSDIAAHSKTKTVSALVKPGYSPYEQYAETSRQQGPWTDIYALSATLYHAVAGKRPPDSPSRMLKDEMQPVREAALGGYRASFLDAIQQGLSLAIDGRPRSVAAWRGALLAPEPEKPGVFARLREKTEVRRRREDDKRAAEEAAKAAMGAVPPPPDAPGPMGGMLDFVASLRHAAPAEAPKAVAPPAPKRAIADKKPTITKKPAVIEKAKAEKFVAAPRPAPPAVLAPERPRKSKGKSRPKPDVARRRSLTRGLKTKLIIAAALTGVVFAFHDQVLRVLVVPPAGLTTGAIATASADPSLNEVAEIKAHDGVIEGIALSGDGRLIVTAPRQAELRVWSFDSRQLKSVIGLEAGPATSLKVRNNRAVTGHADGTVAVYDLDSGRRLYRFKRNDAKIWSVAFAGTEDRIAAASHDWSVAVWETSAEAEPSAVLDGHENAVQALAVDPSGKLLASGGADKTVKLWNLDTRSALRNFRYNSDYITALSFSPDGALLAAGSLDGTIKLWSAANGRQLRTMPGHRTNVTSIAFSSFDDVIASASEDGVVRVRSISRARSNWTLNGIGSGARIVAFTNDGHTLLTGGQDGVIRFWSLPDPQIAQRN